MKIPEKLSSHSANVSHQWEFKRKIADQHSIKPAAIIPEPIRRPWRQTERVQKPETIFEVARQYFGIKTYLDLAKHATTQVIVVFDAGAGSSFFKYSLIPN